MAEAFVYCWTDHKNNKLYVGSHKGPTYDGYVCSSKIMLREYKTRPQDFTRQIIAEGTWDDIFKFEGVILRSLDVKNDMLFYNMHNGSGNFRNKPGYKHTDEWKKENSERVKKQHASGKRDCKGFAGWNKGLTKDDPRVQKYSETLSEVNKGKPGYWTGKKMCNSTIKAVSERSRNNNYAGKRVVTPYGEFESGKSAIKALEGKYSRSQVYDRIKSDKYPDWRYI